jgi:pyridoxal phosphate enzyme (YggS family)
LANIVTTPENKTMTDLESKNNLAQCLSRVKQQIEVASATLSANVQLLAVSKKHPAQKIQLAFELGQCAFGENYVQEGVEKVQTLNHLNIDWHFIGPIQSNKSRLVAEHFSWVHTIDSLKLARRLNEQRPVSLPPLNVLIQVNISQQASKSGVKLEDITALATAIAGMPNLVLRGLMCIPAPLDDSLLKNEFLTMQQQFKQLKQTFLHVDTLSMGMSGDLSLAIESGSTMVRVGSAIFGKRAQ